MVLNLRAIKDAVNLTIRNYATDNDVIGCDYPIVGVVYVDLPTEISDEVFFYLLTCENPEQGYVTAFLSDLESNLRLNGEGYHVTFVDSLCYKDKALPHMLIDELSSHEHPKYGVNISAYSPHELVRRKVSKAIRDYIDNLGQ